ncbi:hypothetical protein [Solimonas variicoloris]|uniref:hypothetical protein n=1 Tax=Solimonas variicoloris TaxID=254408 RepID=UPI0012B639D8|nr:hypothetical protein [Solimonas variicoloris]
MARRKPVGSRPDKIVKAMQRSAHTRCAVPNCGRDVDRFGSWCRRHQDRRSRQGHPTAAAISKVELKPFLARAAAFVMEQDRAGHVGVRAALGWIEGQLESCRNAPALAFSSGTPMEMRWQAWKGRAAREGVTPQQVLSAALAVHLFGKYQPTRLPDRRFTDYQVGAHILRLACRRGYYTKAGRRATRTIGHSSQLRLYAGSLVNNTLIPLLVAAAEAIVRRADREREPVPIHAMQAPFVGAEGNPA